MADPMIFQFIGESVDNALRVFVDKTAETTVSSLVTLAVTSTAFYYVLMGYQIMAGKINRPISQFLISATKFLIIGAFALNAGNYMTWVVETLKSAETGLAATWSGSSTTPDSVYAVVDQAFGKGLGVAGDLWQRADAQPWNEIGTALAEYFNSILILVATLVITLPAGAMIIVAKATLALLFGIGPFFIMSLMWPVTAKWFDAWFGQVMTNIFSIALLCATLSASVKIFAKYIAAVDLNGTTGQNLLFASIQITTLAIVLLWVLYRANSLGAALGGSIAASTISFGQMAAGAIGAVTAPGSTLVKTLNPQSSRLDPNTGLQTTSTRLEHLAMGRSVAARNPAYRQALLEQLQKSWGGRKPGGAIKGGKS